jgi:transcriptional regulator with XRE-family HTH domain
MTINTMTRPEPGHDDHGWPSPPDPGDLSRRVAQRRAELHLSQAQVAARAGVSLRYLEYLERYPARPTPAALRQLAATLRTSQLGSEHDDTR